MAGQTRQVKVGLENPPAASPLLGANFINTVWHRGHLDRHKEAETRMASKALCEIKSKKRQAYFLLYMYTM